MKVRRTANLMVRKVGITHRQINQVNDILDAYMNIHNKNFHEYQLRKASFSLNVAYGQLKINYIMNKV